MASAPVRDHATLRPYSGRDAKAIAEALQDHDLLRWLAALPIPLDQETCGKYLDFLNDPDVRASVICIDGEPVGLVSLGTELSFWLKRACHGQGLGYRAIQAFLTQLPAEAQMVTACCIRENRAAIAILTKLGFTAEENPFRRFSFAHGHAVEFLRFRLRLSKALATPRQLGSYHV